MSRRHGETGTGEHDGVAAFHTADPKAFFHNVSDAVLVTHRDRGPVSAVHDAAVLNGKPEPVARPAFTVLSRPPILIESTSFITFKR